MRPAVVALALAAFALAPAGAGAQPAADCAAHASAETYVSSDRRAVHGPDCDPVAVTAHCRDGTLSHSRHRAGTCSGHHGVASWDAAPP